MGSGGYDYKSSSARASVRATTGDTTFKYSADVKAGKVADADIPHPDVDLRKKGIRESRDVLGKPPATPILMIVDHTGSMGALADKIMNNLHSVMKLIVDGAVVTDPQIALACVGDAHDGSRMKGVFQIGEFEADDMLLEQSASKLYLEGGGGGGNQESYELALYAAARLVKTDAYEKYGEKGFLFIMGDETYYPTVEPEYLERYLGVSAEIAIPTKVIAQELLERWNVMVIRPGGSSNFHDKGILKSWQDLIGAQNVVNVDNWEDINAYIAATISLIAGNSLDDTTAAMSSAGFSAGVVDAAMAALVPLASSAAPIVASGTVGALVESPTDSGVPAPVRF